MECYYVETVRKNDKHFLEDVYGGNVECPSSNISCSGMFRLSNQMKMNISTLRE